MTTPTPTPNPLQTKTVGVELTPEAIEAAEDAYRKVANDTCHPTLREVLTAALTAAAPLMTAQAKGEALAPILALHKPQTIHAVTGECASLKCDHDDIEDCPTLPLEVCAACVEVAENVSEYAMEDDVSPYAYPCATALAATIEGKSE